MAHNGTRQYQFNKALIHLAHKFDTFQFRETKIQMLWQIHAMLNDSPLSRAAFIVAMKESGKLEKFANELVHPSFDTSGPSGPVNEKPSRYAIQFSPTGEFLDQEYPDMGVTDADPSTTEHYNFKVNKVLTGVIKNAIAPAEPPEPVDETFDINEPFQLPEGTGNQWKQLWGNPLNESSYKTQYNSVDYDWIPTGLLQPSADYDYPISDPQTSNVLFMEGNCGVSPYVANSPLANGAMLKFPIGSSIKRYVVEFSFLYFESVYSDQSITFFVGQQKNLDGSVPANENGPDNNRRFDLMLTPATNSYESAPYGEYVDGFGSGTVSMYPSAPHCSGYGNNYDFVFLANFDNGAQDNSHYFVAPSITDSFPTFYYDAYSPGKFGNGLSFVGNPDHGNTANLFYYNTAYDLGSAPYTIGMWIKLNSYPLGTGNRIFWLRDPTVNSNLFVAGHVAGLRVGADGQAPINIPMSLGVWTYIEACRNSIGQFKVFKNGELVAVTGASGIGAGFAHILLHGMDTANSHVNCSMDGVFVVKGQAIHDAPFNPPIRSLLDSAVTTYPNTQYLRMAVEVGEEGANSVCDVSLNGQYLGMMSAPAYEFGEAGYVGFEFRKNTTNTVEDPIYVTRLDMWSEE